MMINTFTQQVLDRLPKLSPEDESSVAHTIQFHCKHMSLNDAVRYARCFEEVNPELPEDVALKRMKEISDKYSPIK
jgi:hypothetical protein